MAAAVQVYFDTSAVLPLFVADAYTQRMQSWVTRTVLTVVLSDFTAAEFAAAVSRGVRIGRLRARAAEAACAYFDRWRLQAETRRTDGNDIAACERLARDFRLKLNAPDALHLAIARAENVALVTFDQRLTAAAALLGHPVLAPTP